MSNAAQLAFWHFCSAWVPSFMRRAMRMLCMCLCGSASRSCAWRVWAVMECAARGGTRHGMEDGASKSEVARAGRHGWGAGLGGIESSWMDRGALGKEGWA
jgi:hypothetical protein